MAARPRAVVVMGVIAVVVAGIASIFLYKYLKVQEQRVKEAVATKSVVTARGAVPIGTVINIGHVTKADWPVASVPSCAFISTDEALGRVSLVTIQTGDPITESKLVPKEGGGILSYRIPEGHRAMTVAVDKVSGVAGFISPGNMVDVIVTAQPLNYKEPVGKIFLQNVPVLATGKIIEQKPTGEPVEVPTVTLDVAPEDAEKLALASAQGKLQLILRRAGDTKTAATPGTTVTKIVALTGTEKRAVVPVKKAVIRTEGKGMSIEIYRGTQKSTESFKAGE